ncbi:uncharacterized protein LOC113068417, partial [Scomber scombrus]
RQTSSRRKEIALSDIKDPYEVSAKEWTRDPDALPPLTFPDIFVYLVCVVSAYTKAPFRNFKFMEAHVQFTNGWVHDLEACKPMSSEYTVVRTKVMHSQRLNEPPLKPWVIVSGAGKEYGHCTCMAGIAETCTYDSSPLLETLLHHSKAAGLSGMEKYYTQYKEYRAAAPPSVLPQCLAKSLYDDSIDARDLKASQYCHEAGVLPTYTDLSINCPDQIGNFPKIGASPNGLIICEWKGCLEDFIMVRIFPDSEFWEARLQKVQDFFKV